MDNYLKNIFKSGSQTFYHSSLFFPAEIRKEVTTLYAFVRTFDDLVDCLPPQQQAFLILKNEYLKTRKGIPSTNIMINAFSHLEKQFNFNPEWIDAFLEAMETDFDATNCQTIKDTEKYMRGSANVIGLLMAKIMQLPSQSYPFAETLAKSFQFINFIRDIEEDVKLGRNYFPQEELVNFGLNNLTWEEVSQHKKQAVKFIHYQLLRYEAWQKEGESGFSFIPPKYLPAIKTAANLYAWTAQIIKKDPLIVYRKKVKPSKPRIIFTGIKNFY